MPTPRAVTNISTVRLCLIYIFPYQSNIFLSSFIKAFSCDKITDKILELLGHIIGNLP